MSRGELWKGVAISLIIGVAFAVIGGHIINYALQMVGIFGESMGVDPRSREIYAETHKWVHLFAAACGLAIGWFYHRRSWFLLTCAVLAVALCGSYGVVNMYGFTSSSRVTVAAVKDAKNNAAEREYLNARADIEKQIKGLEEWAKHAETPREKVLLAKQIDAKRKEMSAIKAPIPTAETVIADTQAYSFATLTASDPRMWMLGMPLLLAILVFGAESFSFIVVGHMAAVIIGMFAAYSAYVRTISVSVEGEAAKNKKISGTGESGGGSTDKLPEISPTQPENVVPIRKVEAQFQAPPQPLPKVSSALPRVPESAPKPSVKLSRDLDEFLANLRPGVVLPNNKQLAKEFGVSEPTMSRKMRRKEGRGQVKRERKGRSGVQTTVLPRRNGGLHALV